MLRAKPAVPHVPCSFSYLARHRSETTARILEIALRNLEAAGFFQADEAARGGHAMGE